MPGVGFKTINPRVGGQTSIICHEVCPQNVMTMSALAQVNCWRDVITVDPCSHHSQPLCTYKVAHEFVQYNSAHNIQMYRPGIMYN